MSSMAARLEMEVRSYSESSPGIAAGLISGLHNNTEGSTITCTLLDLMCNRVQRQKLCCMTYDTIQYKERYDSFNRLGIFVFVVNQLDNECKTHS
ncbi:hypothetical protein ACHQM5_022863 [Ranunculus cassubicifolius]